MAKLAKFLQGVAGAAGGAGLNVEEVFSTYLYDGNATSQTITNGIDLAGEGGLTWIKCRSFATSNYLFDTERGIGDYIKSDSTSSSATNLLYLDGFNSDGFSVRSSGEVNEGGRTYASWTFRKAPKFFDVVTFSTTTGSSTPITVNHNLGSVPGMIIVKTTNIAGDWFVFHRSLGSTKYLDLGSTDQAQTGGTSKWASAPTDTSFTLGGDFVQNATYVAYLFAHNDGDGEFGSEADADIIKCGSYTGNGSTDGPEIDLGFEPQWLLFKNTTTSDNWFMLDTMRQMSVNDAEYLLASASSAAADVGASYVDPTPTGYKIRQGYGSINRSGDTYIYIAIRRGPMAVPESATDVFDVYTGSDSSYKIPTGFATDAVIGTDRSGNDNYVGSRLTGRKAMTSNTSNGEATYGNAFFTDVWQHNDGVQPSLFGSSTAAYWMWKRAPSFCDVVAGVPQGSSWPYYFKHNLGVTPELVIQKVRDGTGPWYTMFKDSSNNWRSMQLQSTAAQTSALGINSYMTDTQVHSLYSPPSDVVCYLFASLDGVSKVGSYTGNGSSNGDSQNIDCGFSSGARFVLIKRTDASSNWLVFDSTRGIVAGNDPLLVLNLTNAEYTTTDEIDPYSAGFAVTVDLSGFATNVSGASYIFYAIA